MFDLSFNESKGTDLTSVIAVPSMAMITRQDAVDLVNWGTGDTCRLQDDKQKTTSDDVRRLPEISPRRY